ncbi:MAG TPA: lysylphosphatidylglycerol synthase transmembrane domain-containing protein [Gaiellaceae bacterium]|nr:lysylphosphatidylglycerol synthase transmembrane domain-containing protein [Gaiellaceae bacterium]
MKRRLRIAATLLATALAVAYILWKIDPRTTLEVLLDADPWWFALACAIMIVTALPMALRWQWMMRAQRMDDSFWWLTRSYFVSYTAGQVLPTAIGGDAVRIVESSRRHPGRLGDLTGIVLLERGLGGAATVLLGAVGFVLAVGRYDLGAYLWLELAFVAGTLVLAVVFFARSVRPLLALTRPLLARLRLERPLRGFYEGVHAFRAHGRVLWWAFVLTLALQAVRILAIWASARAVGIDLSPRVFYVMGPLFFLIALLPITLNGFAVREAFFVSFLGTVGVGADPAFACGFLFFVVTTALAVPGAFVLLWEGLRRRPRPRRA